MKTFRPNRDLLLVDDEAHILSSLVRALRKDGYCIHTADSGQKGLAIAQKVDLGVVVSDQMMPGMDGVTFLERLREIQPDTERILLTAYASLDNAVDAINRSWIFRYLTKPWNPEDLQQTIAKAFSAHNLRRENRFLVHLTRRQNSELQELNENLEGLVEERTRQLEEAVQEGVLMLAKAAEARDDDTGSHIHRIRSASTRLALAAGVPQHEAHEMGFFSMMHDIGKVHVPDCILQKKGPLTDEEFVTMQGHCVAGETILGDKPFYAVARRIARSHHERWDGSGYPDGLAGDRIPLEARIVAIVDVFDALTHARPYKEAWPQAEAMDEMQRLAGRHFDADLLGRFVQLIKENDNGKE
jgi:putative two-component system response regulator